MRIFVDKSGPLSPEDDRELVRQYDEEFGEQIPLLGPLFGLADIAVVFWDYFLDPGQAHLTLMVRVAFVLLGATAYWKTRLGWSPTTRCAVIYLTHTFAAILSPFFLANGLLYQLAGITTCVFPLSILTIQIWRLLALAALPFLLLVCLAAVGTQPFDVVSIIIGYLLSLVVTCMLMQSNRISRKRAFLLERQLTDIARHDNLTGLYNRGYLTETGERELDLARRHGRSLAVAMIDIDHFKAVNDSYGHDIGDLVIRTLADKSLATVRRIDHVGRLGGEEFVCILPETSAPEALACAERLRLAVERLQVPTGQGTIRFTISIGVAVLSPATADWPGLLKQADLALYEAKRTGRNRVVLAAEGAAGEPAAAAQHA